MKNALYEIIENCDIAGKADRQAKVEACAMWKKVIDRFMRNASSPLEQCHLRWMRAAITQYEVVTLSREVFFIYMKGIIDEMK